MSVAWDSICSSDDRHSLDVIRARHRERLERQLRDPKLRAEKESIYDACDIIRPQQGVSTRITTCGSLTVPDSGGAAQQAECK